MAASSQQKQNFVTSFRAFSEQLARVLAQGQNLKDLYTDLGLSGIVDADLTGDNAGLSATDVQAALSTVGTMLTEYTAARRATLNKISHGAP
jgi:hypothetical protein